MNERAMQFTQDIRYAFRQLRRAPGFAVTAVLTLALGVGATTAIFSVVEQMLLTELPYAHADRIVALSTFNADRQHLNPRVVGGDYQDMTAEPAFAALAYYAGGEMGVQLPGHATFTQVEMTSASFPEVFGVRPAAGSLFRTPDASRQALVSAGFADAELGGAQTAVGKLLQVENASYQVVGVLPASFDFPQRTSVWLGAPASPENLNRDSYNYGAVARVQDTLTVAQAQVRLNALSQRLAVQFPVSHAHVQLRAVPLRDALTGRVRRSLWLWLAAVGVLLLIACANVAHLELVRVSKEAQAWAVRAALGASQARIIMSVLLEAALVALAGGAFGVLLSLPAIRLLSGVLSSQLPRPLQATLDLRVLAFCLVLTCAVTAVSAALPCWWASRRDPAAALSRGTRSGGDRGTALWRRGLLGLEVALSFLLLTTSGLLLRTLARIHEQPLGFAAENRLVVYAHAPAHGSAEAEKRIVQLAQLTDQLRALPGVQSAAQTMGLPAGRYGSNGSYAVPAKGQTMEQAGLPWANFSLAGPGYFDAMRIPLVRGRSITVEDTYGTRPVAVVSAALAREAFGSGNPLGQQIVCGLDQDSMRGATIVGVVGDIRQDSPADELTPALYLPLAQHPDRANEVQIVLHTQGAAAALVPAVRARVLAVDPAIATKFTTMDDALAEATEPHRLRAGLLTALATLALLLAVVGIYGVTSYTVALQVREIGIRMALGADRAKVSRQVMRTALRSSAVGMAAGCALCILATHALQGFLVGVPATDPVSYILAGAILMAASSLAALLPAKSAASVEPVVALRTE